jgi:hypothetical protein
MRLLLLVFLCVLLAIPGQAQERVRNIRLRVADSSQVEIRYDLVTSQPGDSVYLEIRSRLRGQLRILPEFVRGDVGKRIEAGSDRRILWNALGNGYTLNEEIRATILVRTGVAPAPRPTPVVAAAKPAPKPKETTIAEKPKLPATVTPQPTGVSPAPVTPTPTAPAVAVPAPKKPEPVQETAPSSQTAIASTPVPADTVKTKKPRYTGPAWALLSAVLPGVGNIFVQTPKAKIGFRPLLTFGCYGLLVYGLQERSNSREVYAVYQQQKNAATGDSYYQTANGHYHNYYLATRGALVVAVADVLLTFSRGLRNQKAQAASRQPTPVTFRPGLQAGQPTAVVRYSF